MVPEPVDTSKAPEFWRGNLDPQNLDRDHPFKALPIETEIAFQNTPDHRAALDWLRGAFDTGGTPVILDLGAGLGAVSLWMARNGGRVIALDSSHARLRELRRRADEAGCADRIMTIAAAAESLPLATASLRAVFTKSVLIHTDLPRAAAEIARVLAPRGRAALDEPQPGNPFAWVYRNTFAPREWKGITRYWGASEQSAVLESIGAGRVRPFYLFAFLAFAFQFALPRPALFRLTLGLFSFVDRGLMPFPFMRRFAWFGLVLAERGRAGRNASDAPPRLS